MKTFVPITIIFLTFFTLAIASIEYCSGFELVLINDEATPYTKKKITIFNENQMGVNSSGNPFIGYLNSDGFMGLTERPQRWVSIERNTGSLIVDSQFPAKFDVNDRNFLVYRNSTYFPGLLLGGGKVQLFVPGSSFPATAGYIAFQLSLSYIVSQKQYC